MAPEQISGTSKRKNKRWLLIILVILILLIIFYFLFLYFRSVSQEQVPNVNSIINQAVTPAPPSTVIAPPVVIDAGSLADAQVINEGTPARNPAEETGAVFIATSFSERLGSYSNQSNYENFDELDMFMTDSMKKWIVQYREDLAKKNPDFNVYYAIETKAISTVSNVFDEKGGVAEIVVKTQRQEFKNDLTNPRVFYQDLLLKLVKIDDEWKVNGAYWQ